MTTAASTRHVLRIADLGDGELAALLDLAARMKAAPFDWAHALPGRSIACYFDRPSTRTRVSMEAACWRLGALPIMLRREELQLRRGETIADTARVLSGYCAAIAVRTARQTDLERLAAAASVPVLNALSSEHHPCQALGDLLTLRERFGNLRGVRLGYVGDGNNVAHSLLEACAMTGVHVTLACPPGYWPNARVVERASALARVRGGRVSVVSEPAEAVAGVHAVYTDVWVSMGDEAQREERREELAHFRIDAALMAEADREAIFMHCLPAHRGEEVTAEVIDGPASAVWQQAANQLPTEQALLYALTTGDWAGERA